MINPKLPSILYVSSFPPRECGIATFTEDLTNAIDKEFNPGIRSKIAAINDNGTSIYNYQQRKVVLQINESKMESYLKTANDINKMKEIKLVNIQHEYGLYGGDWGDYLLPFLELIKKPIVTTMHTILPSPSERLKEITNAIVNRANGVIVMTNTASKILQEEYEIPKKKIFVIPHGVHHVPFPSKTRAKKKLSLQGRIVLSTFGMLNRDKGIEYAIQALPEIVKEFPNVLYLVIGATHPNIVKQEGERYRNKLKKMVEKLKLEDNVKFYNKYVTLEELIEYLKATDIYLSPTLNPRQSVSGTISYALSCACPIVATANQYAQDVITPERGVLVKFRNSKEIEKALFDLLRDKEARKEMKKNAYFYSRHMTWQNVALSYFNTFNNFAKIVPRQKDKLPPVNFRHIETLTDNFGIIQFARHTKPDIYSGYNLDDNVRALIGALDYYHTKPLKSVMELISIYFKFLKYCQKSSGTFHNFLSFNKKFIDKAESDDSFGRAVWALGKVAASDKLPENMTRSAQNMLDKALKNASELKSLRAIAFTMLGLYEIIHKENSTNQFYLSLLKRLADKLVRRHLKQVQENPQWPWFENVLTYANFKLPEALFKAFNLTRNDDYLKTAEKTLEFLTSVTFEKEFYSPIGQDGWYFADGKRAYFDQQPEDASSATEGYATAYRITGNKKYLEYARNTFQWFLGKNHLAQMVYDEATGGCYDGLGKHSLNFNQGAESTISYLLARMAINDIY